MADAKIGALCWNQYSEWPAAHEAGVRAAELGYDTLWTLDQCLCVAAVPSGGSSRVPKPPRYLSHEALLRGSIVHDVRAHVERRGGFSHAPPSTRYNPMLMQAATTRIDLPAASTAEVIAAILDELSRIDVDGR